MRLLAFALLLFLAISCSDDKLPEMEQEEMEPTETSEVWDGPTIIFTKTAVENPLVADNQDRFTDNVWITRGNMGGQIYNAAIEEQAEKATSPAGTRWAIGDIADFASLDYSTFRATVENPKDVVGLKLVMYLVEDDIYVPVEFTSWDKGNPGGGFRYLRGTPQ